MKFKTLRTINKPIEFVYIKYFNKFEVFTCDIPRLYPLTATMENLIQYYKDLNVDIDLSDFELIEIDVLDSGEIGADIRNKLTPLKNLVTLLENHYNIYNLDEDKYEKLLNKNVEQCKISIEYLANLL